MFRRFSDDFFEGAETGLQIIDDRVFGDYSCTLPEPTQIVLNYLNMIEPLRALLDTTASDGRATHPMSDFFGKWSATIQQTGIFFAILSPQYDCGDFC